MRAKTIPVPYTGYEIKKLFKSGLSFSDMAKEKSVTVNTIKKWMENNFGDGKDVSKKVDKIISELRLTKFSIPQRNKKIEYLLNLGWTIKNVAEAIDVKHNTVLNWRYPYMSSKRIDFKPGHESKECKKSQKRICSKPGCNGIVPPGNKFLCNQCFKDNTEEAICAISPIQHKRGANL